VSECKLAVNCRQRPGSPRRAVHSCTRDSNPNPYSPARGENEMPSRQNHIAPLTLALVLGALAAPSAGGQDLLIGQVSSQTSPVTSVNAKGLFVGVNVYFSHVNAQG